MKVTLKQIWGSVQAIGKLKQTNGTSAKANYWIGKLTTKIFKEAQEIENNRNEIIKKYGAEKEDKSWQVKPENNELFIKELNEFLDTEVELNVNKIDIEFLEGRNLSADDFIALDYVINEPKA